METFFVSDTHFFHKNIIEYQRSSWCSSVEEMNDVLISNWNSVVSPHDIVWHLGDFAFAGITRLRDLLLRLHGHIHLVPGNHDDPKVWQKLHDDGIVQLHRPIKNLKLQTAPSSHTRAVLCHFPIESWADCHLGSWHLHGHSHGSSRTFGRRLDVGIDAHEHHRPLHLDEVRDILSQRITQSADYHQVAT